MYNVQGTFDCAEGPLPSDWQGGYQAICNSSLTPRHKPCLDSYKEKTYSYNGTYNSRQP